MTFFFGDHHFFGQHNASSNVIDYYFMAAFTQLWLNTCMDIKYSKKTAAHSLGNTVLHI